MNWNHSHATMRIFVFYLCWIGSVFSFLFSACLLSTKHFKIPLMTSIITSILLLKFVLMWLSANQFLCLPPSRSSLSIASGCSPVSLCLSAGHWDHSSTHDIYLIIARTLWSSLKTWLKLLYYLLAMPLRFLYYTRISTSLFMSNIMSLKFVSMFNDYLWKQI